MSWLGNVVTLHISVPLRIVFTNNSMFLEHFISRILGENISSVFQCRCENNLEDVVFNPFANKVSASVD
jgi:hypothetical protein